MNTKAVFHIDEIEKWKLLIGNVNNLCNGIEPENSEVEILANSAAVSMFTKGSIFNKELEELHRKGIRICACNNALKSFKLSSEDLLEFVEIVPIGVKELIDKQLEGYAYIKP